MTGWWVCGECKTLVNGPHKCAERRGLQVLLLRATMHVVEDPGEDMASAIQTAIERRGE